MACSPSRTAAKCQTNTASSKIKPVRRSRAGSKNRDSSASAGRVRRAADRLSTREAAEC